MKIFSPKEKEAQFFINKTKTLNFESILYRRFDAKQGITAIIILNIISKKKKLSFRVKVGIQRIISYQNSLMMELYLYECTYSKSYNNF